MHPALKLSPRSQEDRDGGGDRGCVSSAAALQLCQVPPARSPKAGSQDALEKIWVQTEMPSPFHALQPLGEKHFLSAPNRLAGVHLRPG